MSPLKIEVSKAQGGLTYVKVNGVKWYRFVGGRYVRRIVRGVGENVLNGYKEWDERAMCTVVAKDILERHGHPED